eukprot:TRINITY_DN31461_c0_g1_i1.p1 TRINITY_DN31461_c0_g1~~TRINITY_DN31461_c0_g1_i1.p1  ORF type:complete len:707 (-),score=89.89 TRINITY_DN31461_c0_g1_i1:56-2176(-)
MLAKTCLACWVLAVSCRTGIGVWQDDSQELVSWLDAYGLGVYSAKLTELGYDELWVLAAMSQEQLQEMLDLAQVKPGHRVKFQLAQESLRSRAETPPQNLVRRLRIGEGGEQQLRESLLAHYPNPPVVPPPNCRVEVSLYIMKIRSVDLTTSTLSFAAWIRYAWRDPRLAFNSSLWNLNYTRFFVEPNAMENLEIWLPDVDILNSDSPIQSSFATKPAMVYPSGDVFWSRPGSLFAACKFRGLLDFPFDHLTCDLELAGWLLDKEKQDVVLSEADGGVVWTGSCTEEEKEVCDGNDLSSPATSGSRYQDYNIFEVSPRRMEKFYSSTGRFYPTLLYTITLKRSEGFYFMKLMVPQLSLGCLSWLTYFLDPQAGERMGFGITLVLAVLTLDFASQEYLPRCDEMTIMHYITWGVWAACIFALLESSVVLYLYHFEAIFLTDLLPSCIKRRIKAVSVYEDALAQVTSRGSPKSDDQNATPQELPDSLKDLPEAWRSSLEAEPKDAEVDADMAGPGEVNLNEVQIPSSVMPSDPSTRSVTEVRPTASASSNSPKSRRSWFGKKSKRDGGSRSTLPTLRRGLYMRAFYALDHGSTGGLSEHELRTLGKFVQGSAWSEAALKEWMKKVDCDGSNDVSFSEFMHFFDEMFASVAEAQVDEMLRSFIDIAEQRAEKVRRHWRRRALAIDMACRKWVPPIHILQLIVLLAVRLA